MSARTSSYQGSQIFAGLAQYAGLETDQLNFLISQIVALLLSTLYRTVLHPSKTRTEIRHAFGLVVGLCMGYFCFGFQAIHLAGLPMICYMIMITQNPHIMHGMVLTVALIYLSCVHLHRQIYDYGSYGLDISGPLMVITQKVISLAFSLHDGLTKQQEEMTHNQKYHAVYKTPNVLEYFSYSLLFPSLMAGPIIFYNDYVDFIEGNNYVKARNSVENSKVVREPSPVKAIIKKVAIALFCAYIFLKFLPRFPIARVKDQHFVENTSISYIFWYLTVSTTLVRFKYYFAWTIADAICNNCGIGFSGYAEDGTDRWDKISNVDIFQFEFATSLKQGIEAWNKGTNIWLRMIVYERTKKFPTVLTYVLSAVWHGFYPGYYLTFLSGAVFTFAARTVRRHVRNYFMTTKEAKLLYDLITFAVTHFVFAYLTFPFVSLEFWSSIVLYNRMYWCLHLGAIAAMIFLPQCVPKSQARELSSKSGIALALRQAGPYSRNE
ncbi:lysophospholipid acyltransferase 6 [Diabrotica virgifera virgifera]|uniref:Lysophospholipid acyltransferase 2 n=1 Tax=Diabrotica virgifera virgifera TaxID=50390 RepID=A0A6P7F6F9_DIAVI|nr:lysophospholipid acyltransferase 6 [Diabrotica virgifera virgifera]